MTGADVRRAGYWRRAAVVILDCLLVLLPLQALVMAAFLLSDGRIQGGFGVLHTACEPYSVPVEVLAKLQPPPPEDANMVLFCRSGLFGYDIAANLVASRHTVTKEGGGTTETDISVSYPMNARGQFVDAIHTDILAYAALAVAIVWQWARRGRTIGGRLVCLRVIRTKDGGVPVTDADAIGWVAACKRLALSVLVSAAFILPAFLLAQAFAWRAMQSGQVRLLWIALGVVVVGCLAQAVLSVVILIDIVKRRDPLYDRWAKTAAVIG